MLNKRNLIIIISALIILIVVVLVMVLFIKPKDSIKLPTKKTSEEVIKIEKDKQQDFNNTIDDTVKIDKDLDGLLDSDEEKYGTNPTKSDTDSDGLLDSDEINIYKTNPLKADTDGDGHMDGIEVRNNYNPNGTGKLP